MKKNLQNILTFSMIVLINFIITTVIYYASFVKGNNGIAIDLFGGGNDGYFYWEQAMNVVNGNNWIRTSIYPLVIGTLMKYTGIHHVYLIRIFNLIGLLMVYCLSFSLLSKTILNNNLKKYNVPSITGTLFLLVMLCYPSLLMNTHLSIYRDVWIYLFYILNILLTSSIAINSKFSFNKILLLLVSEIMLFEFREYAAVSFVVGILVYKLYSFLKKRGQIKILLFYLIAIFAIYYTFLIDFRVPILNKSLSDVLLMRSTGIEFFSGGSQMNITLNQSNILLFFYNYLISYIYNLIGPLPWQINSIGTLVVFFTESLTFIYILSFIFKNRKKITNAESYLLFHGFIWNGFIAIFNDNLGTAARLRVPTGILLIITYFSLKLHLKYTNENKIKNEN